MGIESKERAEERREASKKRRRINGRGPRIGEESRGAPKFLYRAHITTAAQIQRWS